MRSRGEVGTRLATRAALLLVSGVLLISGCTTAAGDGADSQPASTTPPKPVSLTLAPGHGTADFAPGAPVTAAVEHGTITGAKLVGEDGTVVAGAPAPDGKGWSTTEKLGYGKTYTMTVTATGGAGKPVTKTSTFHTATPRSQVGVSMNVADGATVGVGMPLIFTFTRGIEDKAAAERALRIDTEPRAEGAFHWFSDRRVVWRPKEYLRSGTTVTVNASIYGTHLGGGTYGRQDQAASITVGDKVVAVADGESHQMTVRVNDKEVRTMPLSMGKPSSPTPQGTYTVMSEHVGFTMDSSTYGVPSDSAAGYRTWVQYAVRMSNSGIFYHSAPWSVGSQGERNVSHGCINLSTANAKWLKNTSQPGDIIVVQNSGGQELEPTDGWSVWQMPWDEWKSGGDKN